MSKESFKNKIVSQRKEMVSLRARLLKIKDDKKRKMEQVTKTIKSSSSTSIKEQYRKTKISESARFDRQIEELKKKIEYVKKQIDQARISLANLK